MKEPKKLPNSTYRLAVVLLLAGLFALLLYFVRPPGPGGVYQYRSGEYGLQGGTALVLRKDDCLVLSRSQQDVGKTQASPGTRARLFAIAGAGGVESGSDGQGPYIADHRSGRAARPGDAIDGEMVFRPRIGSWGDTLRAGWLLDARCGSGLAIIYSIERVHR